MWLPRGKQKSWGLQGATKKNMNGKITTVYCSYPIKTCTEYVLWIIWYWAKFSHLGRCAMLCHAMLHYAIWYLPINMLEERQPCAILILILWCCLFDIISCWETRKHKHTSYIYCSTKYDVLPVRHAVTYCKRHDNDILPVPLRVS